MYGSSTTLGFSSSSGTGTSSSVSLAPAPAAPAATTGKDKLEARLQAALTSAGVSDDNLNKFGDNDVLSVSIFANLADDVKDFRAKLDMMDIKADTLAGSIVQSAIVGVWKSMRVTTDVEDQAQAQRIQLNLKPSILPKDLAALIKVFEKTDERFKVTKYVCPSKTYFERKIGEVETTFEAEHLTLVTTGETEEKAGTPNDAGLESLLVPMVAKTYRVSSKEIRVAMPDNPEELRARLKTMGLAFVLLRLRFPSKAVLRTATMQMFQHYTDWLFGPDVWGKASLGVDGQPVATPALKHVLIYDYAIRQRVSDNMNGGMDIKLAFAEATADIDTRLTHFFGNVQLDIGSAACRAISAPGLTAPKSTSKGSSKAADENDDDKTARNRAKRLRSKANKAQKAASPRRGQRFRLSRRKRSKLFRTAGSATAPRAQARAAARTQARPSCSTRRPRAR